MGAVKTKNVASILEFLPPPPTTHTHANHPLVKGKQIKKKKKCCFEQCRAIPIFQTNDMCFVATFRTCIHFSFNGDANLLRDKNSTIGNSSRIYFFQKKKISSQKRIDIIFFCGNCNAIVER